jgi:hypothetical protein
MDLRAPSIARGAKGVQFHRTHSNGRDARSTQSHGDGPPEGHVRVAVLAGEDREGAGCACAVSSWLASSVRCSVIMALPLGWKSTI